MKMSLKSKILMLGLLLSTFTIAIAAFSFYSNNQIISINAKVRNEIDLPNQYLNELVSNYRKTRLYLNLIVNTHTPSSIKEKSFSKIEEGIKDNEAIEDKYKSSNLDEVEKKNYDQIEAKIKVVFDQMKQIRDLSKNPTVDTQVKVDKILYTELDLATAEFISLIKEDINYKTKKGDDYIANLNKTEKRSRMLNVVLSLVSILFGIVLALIISSNISKKITIISQEIQKESARLSENSENLSSFSSDLSDGVSKQASSITQTSASVEELSAMVNKTTDNCFTAQETAEHSKQNSEEGARKMDSMIESIGEIKEANQLLNDQISKNNDSFNALLSIINQIQEKTKVINDIVFQTKLLSFNASIEAARAGNAGLGFSVVAEEVGKLAQMSGNSAKEINELLKGSIEKSHQILAESKEETQKITETSNRKIEMGIEQVEECKKSLDLILSNIGQISEVSKEISLAAKEQSIGISEINKATSMMDEVTQVNSSNSEKVKLTSQELNSQVKSLQSIIDNLNETIEGKKVA